MMFFYDKAYLSWVPKATSFIAQIQKHFMHRKESYFFFPSEYGMLFPKNTKSSWRLLTKSQKEDSKGPSTSGTLGIQSSTSQVGQWRGNPLCVLQGPGEKGQVAIWTFWQICFSTQPSSAGFINHSATLPSTLVWVIGFSGVVITRMLRAKVWSCQIRPLCLPSAIPSLMSPLSFPPRAQGLHTNPYQPGLSSERSHWDTPCVFPSSVLTLHLPLQRKLLST